MPEFYIVTEKVEEFAGALERDVDATEKKIEQIEKTVNSLSGDWQSDAATAALGAFDKVIGIINNRNTVLKDYVRLLKNVVVGGHLNAEQTNNDLASMFK